MASLGTRDALTLVERDTAESRGGFSGAHAGDSPVVVEQRDQSRGRSSRIVIIDRRQLVGRCLAASLSEADRQTSFEVFADIEQGADMVMVKPALPYLDILRQVRDAVDVPVAAYSVSGEYSMVEAAAANGWLDRERTIDESLLAIRRAGADIILSYWALEWAQRHR